MCLSKAVEVIGEAELCNPTADAGGPYSYCKGEVVPLSGANSTALAGTIVTHNAEVLGGITLNQLVRKGAPVIYGSSTTAMDLKIAAASVGTPECAVISGAVARLARYYALPSYVAGG